MDAFSGKAIELAAAYVPKFALAIITLLIGLWAVGVVTGLVRRLMESRKFDKTLTPFLMSLLNWMLKALLLISVASMVGIETTSFVAVLGAAGLAVGLALQGTLANFAGGALILIFRPYEVGDLIKAQGHLGVVKEIQIFTTVLVSPENKRIILPNGVISNGTITNLSAEGVIRTDVAVGIDYGADMKQAKEVLLAMLKKNEFVLDEPAPMVAVAELADNSVNLVVRGFCKPEHYWDVFFGVTEGSKEVLDEAGIGIPFPQRDVHLYNHDATV